LTLNQKKELNSYFELWKTGQNSASDWSNPNVNNQSTTDVSKPDVKI
jgi:hypothetical protein